MINIPNLSEFQYSLPLFSIEQNFNLFYNQFLSSDLGKIYQSVPWEDLVKTFQFRSHSKGPRCIFTPQGKLALMFLKNYTGSSDKRLIDQLNSNYYYQFFCGICLGIGQEITNYKIVSQIRCEVSQNLNIDRAQACLAKSWLPFMEELNMVVMDATCYESDLRFPTDQKLLFEAVEWSYGQMKLLCKCGNVSLPRTKYHKWSQRYWNYSRKRRKSTKERTVITRALLGLLEKILKELNSIVSQIEVQMPDKYYRQLRVVSKVLMQQTYKFTTGNNPQDRIVSLSKSYIRPIVRGKETKTVEFGAKVNKIQVNGISFIEHLSFDAFNEGTRFKSSIQLSRSLTHTQVNIAGADAIFATNANRKYASSNNIQTDFVRKGRAGKYETQRKQLAKMIKKERATRLEGSFGKDKQHYHLQKIKARTQENEILWIFFGIHVSNALEIGRRMQNRLSTAA